MPTNPKKPHLIPCAWSANAIAHMTVASSHRKVLGLFGTRIARLRRRATRSGAVAAGLHRRGSAGGGGRGEGRGGGRGGSGGAGGGGGPPRRARAVAAGGEGGPAARHDTPKTTPLTSCPRC